MPWTLKAAWRLGRGDRRRLVLFLAAMMVGVAALVSIHGFGFNLRGAVDRQAKELLGADLGLSARQSFDEETEALIDSLGGEQSRRVSFSSMAFFPKGEQARLVRVRAHEGGYPFYGRLGTDPPQAARQYLDDGRRALVDATLMRQFEQQVGDSVHIGDVAYEIAGALEKMPQEAAALSLVSPRIYVPLAELDSTLLEKGSRAEYEIYFQFDDDARNVKALAERLRPRLEKRNVEVLTPAQEAEDWGHALENLYRFLSLMAFVALLLGGLGVASAVHVYIRRQQDTVAVLRCLGASPGRAFGVYLTQAAGMGLLCAVGGIALGLAAQALLPRVLADFLPVEVSFRVSMAAVALGGGVGLGGTLLFALLPLVGVRRVSPLRSLRSAFEPSSQGTDGLRVFLFVLLAALIAGAAAWQAPDWRIGLGYAGGLAVVFGVLAGLARLVTSGMRRLVPTAAPYPLRQGLSNLYRPHNQTTLLTLALGFGTFVLLTLYLVQATLLAQFDLAGGDDQPSLILFGIQPDQTEKVTRLVRERGLPVLDRVPIVPMQLKAVKGRSVEAIEEDSTTNYTWAHRREYRATYRDSLSATETITAGTFQRESFEGEGAVPVSVETEIAEELGVVLGDSLTFNVQGRSIETVVGSLREVNWRRLSTNFFVVFPEGVLEEAPQSSVVLTRSDSSAASAALQADVAKQFPSVSVIDAGTVVSVLDALFDRFTFIVRFMAGFSILTGIAVLAGAVMVSRYQRARESVLLKTLGASRRQVFGVLLSEYLVLGVLAAGAGVVLALGAGWGLAHFVFEAPLVVPPVALAVAFVGVTGLVAVIGLLSSRNLYDQPALETLRMAG